jgi:hypothetical protein
LGKAGDQKVHCKTHHRVDRRVLENSLSKFLGALEKTLTSRMKILGGLSMVGSHANGSDTEREPKIGRIKDQLVILENIVE